MKRLIPFILFLCFFHRNTTIAQNFSGFNKVEGLNSNVVYCVMQDSKGYIWVGTEAGASRYDGYKFTHYTIDDGLTDNDVFQIHEDQKGRLWFLTNNGKPCLYENGKILNDLNTGWLQHIQPTKMAKDFLLDADYNIWFTCLDTAYKIVNDKVVNKIAVKNIWGVADNLQYAFEYKGCIYLTSNSGIYNVNTQAKIKFEADKQIRIVNSRVLLKGDELYYISLNEIFVYNLKKGISYKIDSKLNREKFIVFTKHQLGSDVMVTTKSAVFSLNEKTKTISSTNEFPAEFISEILTDEESNIWVASLTKGLFIRKPKKTYKLKKLALVGSSLDVISRVIQPIDSTIYIGFTEGYYGKIINDTIEIQKLNYTNSQSKMLQLYKHKNTISFVTSNAVVNLTKQTFKKVSETTKNIAENTSAFYTCTNFAIEKFYKKIAGLDDLNYGTKKGQLIYAQRASVLFMNNEDTLWAGGILGLKLFVKDKLVEKIPWKNEVIHGNITTITQSTSKDILFATANLGIGIIHGDTMYHIDKSNGLLSNKCNNIFSANDSVIWVATAKGINKINYKISVNKSISTTVIDFNKQIHLDYKNINDIYIQRNKIYFAAEDGVYVYNSDIKEPTPIHPKLIIESVQVNDSVYKFQPVYRLSYQQNRIRINFIGLSFAAHDKLVYRYRLLPIDTNWQYTTNTFVEYPFLTPNNYTFEIAGLNAEENCCPDVHRIAFNINKPFWLQWWFVALVIVALVFAVRYIIGNAKKTFLIERQSMQMKLDKAAFDKQLAELQQKALTLQMNPHFIFNAINSIKGFYAAGNEEKAKDFINAFSKLMRSMLDISSINIHSLQHEIEFTRQYLDFCLLRYNNSFVYQFSIAESINSSMLKIPVMLLQPIVENAVLHGLTPLTKQGELFISIDTEENKLVIIIDDNGIGRKESQRMNSYTNHNEKGIELVKQRIHLMAEGKAGFGFVVEDKQDNLQIAIGTKVILTIPLINT